MMKLKFQYFGHLMQRVDSLEKTPMLGKIEGRYCVSINDVGFQQALGAYPEPGGGSN